MKNRFPDLIEVTKTGLTSWEPVSPVTFSPSFIPGETMTSTGSRASPWGSPYSNEYPSRSCAREAKQPIAIRHRTVFHALLCALLFGGQWFITASAETNNLPAATEHLNRFLAELDTLTANFQQVLFDEQGRSLEDSRGVVYLARPKRFHWEYREPYRQTIIADGKRIWFYDEDISQVIVKPWGSFSLDTPAALLITGEPLENIFTVRDLGSTRASSDGTWSTRQWVQLTPKSSDATFTRIKLGLGNGTIEIMELLDSFGQTTRLVFSEIAMNPKLDPRLFSFTPPEGADVVGLEAKGAKQRP
uniref:Outer-membrane lipoprotein carrier protein n=1 Tax=Candidatus Kentrum sp. TC TaxID=2126339 RepID=A0A450YRQ1_9GAMM|nr:MAG: outer membrane lipoprotein carrier protein [Candidatus Kentron sp. TC]VFK60574.1 MAG: outer membrane lipoprotein carrier protein [Candidatus Kentron sp. TC]